MSPLNRAEKRRREREVKKIRTMEEKQIMNRKYSFQELSEIVDVSLKNQERDFDMMYAIAMATTLAAPPLNFRNKRVCSFIKDFFGQVEAMQQKHLSLDELKIEAAKVGVLLKDRGVGLEVYIDPKYKYKEGDVLR